MMPPSSRRNVILLVIGLAAIGAAVIAIRMGRSPGADVRDRELTAPPPRPVTVEEYRLEVRAILVGFDVSDTAAASDAITALLALTVPAAERETHLDLVTALTAYRDAFAAADPSATRAAEVRLGALAASAEWIGLVIPAPAR
jgi:hypothetical protein